MKTTQRLACFPALVCLVLATLGCELLWPGDRIELTVVDRPQVRFGANGMALIVHDQHLLRRDPADPTRDAISQSEAWVQRYDYDQQQFSVVSRLDSFSESGLRVEADESGAAITVLERTGGMLLCHGGDTAPSDCGLVVGPGVNTSAIVAMDSSGRGIVTATFAAAGEIQTVEVHVTPGNVRAPRTMTIPYKPRDGTLAYFASGTALAMWVTDASILVSRYSRESDAWETPETLGAVHVRQRRTFDAPLLLVHRASSRAAVVWRTASGLEYRRYSDAAGWGPPEEIPDSSVTRIEDDGTRPAGAMLPNGDLFVLWRDSSALIASEYADGAWTAPRPIAFPILMEQQVACDDAGNAVVMFGATGERTNNALHLIRYVRGEGWHQAVEIAALAQDAFSDDYALAMDANGRAVVAFVKPVRIDADAFANADAGTRLGVMRVGFNDLTMTATRHLFGGEQLSVTVRLNEPAQAGDTLSLASTLASNVPGLPLTIPLTAGQRDVSLQSSTLPVANFADGSITATFRGVTASALVTLMPDPASVQLTLTPITVPGGQAATARIDVVPEYPVPMQIQLVSDLPVAQVPATISLPANRGFASATVTTSTTATAQVATITATLRNRSDRRTLGVDPTSLGFATLSVVRIGGGTVTSTPSGIDCGADCDEAFPLGTAVTLSGAPAAGQRFFGWQGDADCSDGVVTILAALTCEAVFQAQMQPPPSGMGWIDQGPPITTVSDVDTTPALALDGINPVVAYIEAVGGDIGRVHVSRLNGATWEQLDVNGLNVVGLASATDPAIAMAIGGMPFVAWSEANGVGSNIHVKRYTGTAWVAVGGALNFVPGSDARRPSITLDREVRPIVAWIEDGVVKVKRFDGGAWVAMSGGEGPASAAVDRVEVGRQGSGSGTSTADFVIVWTQGEGATRALKVVRGENFDPLGNQVNVPADGPVDFFDFTPEFSGALVGYSGRVPHTIRVRHFVAGAWVDFASNDVQNNNPNELVALAMDPVTPMVAHSFSLINADVNVTHVSHRPGNNWIIVAATITGPRATAPALLSLRAVTLTSPMLAWSVRTDVPNVGTRYSVRVSRYFP